MIITLLRNKTGLIHGDEPKRITCSTGGTLVIGKTEVKIIPGNDEIMPLLYHGATGIYDATYTDIFGAVYNLGKVEVRRGRICSPSPTALELLELKCRADLAECEVSHLKEEIEELKGIFDTNSLNFLIKGETE
jgi:hypothetical protein